MIKLLKTVTILILFTVIDLFPQNEHPDLLELLQLKFDSVESFSVKFIQSNNGNTNLSGTVYFKKENNIKILSDRLFIVSNGETSWNYNKIENKVIISNFDESDPGVFSLNEIVYSFPAECDVSFGDSEGQRHIMLIPTGYKNNFDSVKLWLNDENLISKVLIIDSVMGKTGVEFSNYNLNLGLKDSEFTFIPFEGSKIIDLR